MARSKGWKQVVYSDFSGGFNDTSAAVAIKDSELAFSENADYAAEVKALQTRKGCSKVNTVSYNGDVTDGYSWLIGSVFKKCVVVDGTLYDVDIKTGELTEKIQLTEGATNIYPYVLYNVLYFGDGTELYEWGAFDYATELGEKEIKTGDIIRCDNDTIGVKGAFYKALKDLGKIDLGLIDYRQRTEDGDFEECTDVNNFSSSVVRPMTIYDPSKEEIVSFKVWNSASSAGKITLSVSDKTGEITVAQGETVASIVSKLGALTIEGWTTSTTGNTVKFTANKKEAVNTVHYADPSTTGVEFTIETEQEGHDNDCNIEDIKKCTIFCVHQGSYRVFAAGNPEDNALYYSEIGNGKYFKSDINKVYPAINGYGHVTAMTNLSDALLVSYENGWYSWSGTKPLEDAYWKPLNIPYGCVSDRTLCLTPSSFTFLGRDGVYCVSEAILSDEYVLLEGSSVLSNLSENQVEKTLLEMKNKRITEAIFYENTYFLAYSTNGEYCDKVLKYEWNTKSFTLVTGWRVNRWMNDPEELYFCSKNYILNALTGYHDIDVETGQPKPIELRVKTKEYHFGTPLTDKLCQIVGFIFQQHDEVEAHVDITLHAGYRHYNIGNQDLAESLSFGRTWGKVWGYREAIAKTAEIIMISNTFQIEIKNNNLDDPVTLIGIGFIYDNSDVITPTILKDEVLLR